MAMVDFASVGAAVSAGQVALVLILILILVPQPLIVDVRTADEFAAGRIPGAVNIPLSEV